MGELIWDCVRACYACFQRSAGKRNFSRLLQ
jgi:hypothetical protein